MAILSLSDRHQNESHFNCGSRIGPDFVARLDRCRNHYSAFLGNQEQPSPPNSREQSQVGCRNLRRVEAGFVFQDVPRWLARPDLQSSGPAGKIGQFSSALSQIVNRTAGRRVGPHLEQWPELSIPNSGMTAIASRSRIPYGTMAFS